MISIVNYWQGKADALEIEKYRCLKLKEYIVKIFERVIEKLIRQQVEINKVQLGFMLGHRTRDNSFILSELQEKYFSKKKDVYFAFEDSGRGHD